MAAADDAGAVMDVIRRRRSVRRFKSDPVPDDAIRQMVEAARWAPIGGNRQVCRFAAIRNKDTIQAMRDAVASAIAALRQQVDSSRAQQQFDGYAAHFSHFAEAPCVIAVIAKPYDSIYSRIVRKYVPEADRPPQHLVDIAAMSVAAAVENLLLAATALGYGACFMTGPIVAQKELGAILDVEDPWHVVTLVPVGLPATDLGEGSRAPLDSMLSVD